MTKESIEIRRRKVWKLSLQGYTWDNIAEALGVSQKTIERDIREFRRTMRGGVEEFDALAEISEAVAVYAEVEQRALQDYVANAGKSLNGSVGMLRVVIDARAKRIQLFQEAGFLRRDLGTLQVDDERTRELQDMDERQLATWVRKEQKSVARLLSMFEDDSKPVKKKAGKKQVH